ncbi:MAG: GIY-YIG nuclease family protein [Ignavibacteria bacterium]|nr:GIY-YIG nuclease family protein [Ignavibacteria bacterium]
MKTNKELKEEYKQQKLPAGVFQIRNTVNGKIFIDSSTTLKTVFNRHKVTLNFGSHVNTVLQKEWKEYGEDKFVYEILGEIKLTDDDSIALANEARQLKEMYIEDLKPFGEKGYHKKA